MSGMMGWLVFAVSVAAYVAAGWRLAVVQIPRMSEEVWREWGTIPKYAAEPGSVCAGHYSWSRTQSRLVEFAALC